MILRLLSERKEKIIENKLSPITLRPNLDAPPYRTALATNSTQWELLGGLESRASTANTGNSSPSRNSHHDVEIHRIVCVAQFET